jgi:hypothetical protein
MLELRLLISGRSGSRGACHARKLNQAEARMKLSAPKQLTFWIAVVFGVLSVIFKIVPALWLLGLAGWFAIIGLFILIAGNVIEGL